VVQEPARHAFRTETEGRAAIQLADPRGRKEGRGVIKRYDTMPIRRKTSKMAAGLSTLRMKREKKRGKDFPVNPWPKKMLNCANNGPITSMEMATETKRKSISSKKRFRPVYWGRGGNLPTVIT